MDRKDSFDESARPRRTIGNPEKRGLFESVEESILARSPLPIADALPRAIEFQRKTESWFSFPYHCLMNIEYRPHDRITLGFSTHRVAIKGRSLEAVYEGLRTQSYERITESDRADALASVGSDAEVQSIEINELEWGDTTL